MHVRLFINPNNHDISEIPLIKKIRFFINQIKKNNGVKLTKAGYLPPALVKELYEQNFIKDTLIELGISKLCKETDANIIVLTRILCELSGLIKKRNGMLTLTKKTNGIVNKNTLLPLIFFTFMNQFSWNFFDGYEDDYIGQFGCDYSLLMIAKFGDIRRDCMYYAEKYFKAFPHLHTLSSAYDTYNRNYNCYIVRTFPRFVDYFGFTETTEKKLLDSFTSTKKTDLFDKFIVFEN